MASRHLNLAVLVSGGGSTLQNLLDRSREKSLPATVKLVIGSRPNLGAEPRAMAAGVPYHVVDRKSFVDDASFSARIYSIIEEQPIDLICLGGFLSKLNIPEKWRNRVLNVHPSLLPSFGGKGMYGLRVHQAVLDHGCKVSGCSVHIVDEGYDTGPIVVQKCCEVLDDETIESLTHKVQELERDAYPQAIARLAKGKMRIDGRRVRF